MADWDITDDDELESAVRAETGYDESDLSNDRLFSILDRAKHLLNLKTGESDWYTDSGLGFALFGYACIRAKSSVENIPLDSYDLLDESVSFNTDDPNDSVQLQQWHQDVKVGLQASSATDTTTRKPTNTADYIGESYIVDDSYDRNRY